MDIYKEYPEGTIFSLRKVYHVSVKKYNFNEVFGSVGFDLDHEPDEAELLSLTHKADEKMGCHRFRTSVEVKVQYYRMAEVPKKEEASIGAA